MKQTGFTPKQMARYVIIAICLLFALMIGCGSCFSVGAGEVGVTFNKWTGTTESYQKGLHGKLPLITSVTHFDVKTRKVEFEAASASKDLQQVKVDVVLNYHLQYDKVNTLFVKVGEDYSIKVIEPAVFESVKATTAQFPVEDIIVKREKVKEGIEKVLAERLLVYDIVLESINLVNITFDKDFTRVVEEKQIEEQKIKTAEYKRQQAEKEKQTTILQAQGEAEKQRLMSVSTSQVGIDLQWINKWDGKLPEYMMGSSGTVMMINPKGK